MRRKSERNKGKSPEPVTKAERPKRGRLSRKTRKSPSPDEDSKSDDVPQVQDTVQSGSERRKSGEGNSEDSSELVWQVKKSESSSNTGEIQKLKICLARSPSTPERPERSPRGKKRSSHSSIDTLSDASEEKRKSRKARRNSAKETIIEGVSETEDAYSDHEEVIEMSPKICEASQLDTSENNQSEAYCKINPDVPEVSSISNDGNDGKIVDEKSDVVEKEAAVPKELIVVEEEIVTCQEPENIVQKCIQEENKIDIEKPTSPVDIQGNICENNQQEEIPETEEKAGEEVSNEKSENSENVEACAEKCVEIAENNIEQNATNSNDDKEDKKVIQSDSCIPDKSGSCDGSEIVSSNIIEENIEDGKVENTIEQGSTRKRRWGSRSSKNSKSSTVCISTNSLKSLIPKIDPISVEDVLLEVKTKEESQSEKDNEEEKSDQKYNNVTEKPKEREREILGGSSHRKISIVSDDVSKEQRSPSPPRHKASSVLYITNLVRPFTLPQLKNLLLRTGKIVENGFWIDKIKSRCYVQYQNEDEAIETRHALHGVTWPVSNPKTLIVDFSSESAMHDTMNKGEDEKLISSTEFRSKDQGSKENNFKQENEVYEKRTVIREWDVGKGENVRDMKDDSLHRNSQEYIRSSHFDGDRNDKRKRSKSPSPARKFKKKEEEAPSKLLDDLFRKTKATPCIYWLPLNAETILIKEEQRRKHMADHERRMEDLRRVNEKMRSSGYNYSAPNRHR